MREATSLCQIGPALTPFEESASFSLTLQYSSTLLTQQQELKGTRKSDATFDSTHVYIFVLLRRVSRPLAAELLGIT